VPQLWLLDGLRPVDPAQPVLRADDLGVLHGESAFETVRIAGGIPALLDPHLARLAASAERLGVALPDGFRELARAACRGQGDAVLRLVCTNGPPPVGYALWLLGGVKTTSYAVNMASLRHARDEGAEDAIWLSSDGEVLEGATSAVAIVQQGILVTPPADLGILASTTLAAVLTLELVPARVRSFAAEELHQADEVMLMSSIRGVVPVISLDGRTRPVGPITAALSQAFEASLQP
jgi:4-amino-4-deoxychorismate lyase